MKQCRRCLACKPLRDFPTSKRNKDGFESYCKPCKKDYSHQNYMEYRKQGKRKHPPLYERFWSKVGIAGKDECWLWKASCTVFGYGQLYYHGKPERAHRLAWLLTYGDIPTGMHVLHKCDVPACCNVNHLFLGTHQENMYDMITKMRYAHGDDFTNSKLTSDKVIKMRELYDSGLYTTTEIGEVFHTSRQNVNDIGKRRSWKHL